MMHRYMKCSNSSAHGLNFKQSILVQQKLGLDLFGFRTMPQIPQYIHAMLTKVQICDQTSFQVYTG